MERVLLTGGSGFVGSQICRQLVAQSYDVTVYDAFINYISPLESLYQRYLEKRFEGIADKLTIVRGNTLNKADLRRVIMKYQPDRIIHLAALPIADLANIQSEEALNSILHGAVNILEVIRDTDFVKRFVYISSSMVYGDFQYVPADEEHPKVPKEIYGGTKYAGEVITQTFGRRYGIEYTIIRPSAVYGPTDVNRRVSQIFVENALKGKPIFLHNGGQNKLDFTYIEDIAKGIILAAFKDEGKNEVFNITRGEGRSLAEYADILRSYFPDLKIETKPADLFRPNRGALDISKARELLGYSPTYSLEDGIKLYVEFLKSINSTPS